MAFSQKLINIVFTLANGQFQGGGNTANLEGLRISARIDGMGGIGCQTATAAIWGMPLSMMNQLSLIGQQIFTTSPLNTISITAGDSPQNMPLAFSGIIRSAFVDASAQPQVCFRVEASPTGAIAAQPTDASGANGTLDVAQKMQALAGLVDPPLQFENHGVSIQLRDQYLDGTIWNQINTLARIAPCEVSVDRGKLEIWIPGKGPSSGITLDSSNMVGYPAFSQANIYVRTLFNPSIRLGQTFKVKSELQAASGTWQINNFTHEIESNIPKGKWFTVIGGAPFSTQTV